MCCPYITWKCRAHFGSCSRRKQSPMHRGWTDHSGCITHLYWEAGIPIATVSLLYLCNSSHCQAQGKRNFFFVHSHFPTFMYKELPSLFYPKSKLQKSQILHVTKMNLISWFSKVHFALAGRLCQTFSEAGVYLLDVSFCTALRTKWFVNSRIDPDLCLCMLRKCIFKDIDTIKN